MKFCTVIWGSKCKIEFVWDKNLTTLSPILPQFLTSIMHFQWEGSCTTVENPVGLYWRLIAQKACLGGRCRRKKEK